MGSEKKRTVVIGGGGHSHSVCDILLTDKSIEIIGIVDSSITDGFYGLKVLGGDECLDDIFKSGEAEYAFVAIGSNSIRKKLVQKILGIGFKPVNAVSPYAVISPNAEVCLGTAVMAGAIINGGAHIGQYSIINTNCSIDHDTVIGNYAHIAPGCAVCGAVTVGEGAFVGVGTSVADSVRIGVNTTIGAGAAVVTDIPDNCTAVGVPARAIKFKGTQA